MISERSEKRDVRQPTSEAPESEAFPEHRSLDEQDGVARKLRTENMQKTSHTALNSWEQGGTCDFWKKHANRRSGPGIRTSWSLSPQPEGREVQTYLQRNDRFELPRPTHTAAARAAHKAIISNQVP